MVAIQSILGSSVTTFNTATINNGSTVTGTTQHNATIFNILGGGKYIQTINSGVVPGTTRNFNAASTYEWQTGGNNIFPSTAGINFGNLVINTATGANTANGNLSTINGNLVIQNTTGGSYSLSSTQSPALTVGGNLLVESGLFTLTSTGKPNYDCKWKCHFKWRYLTA